MKGGKAGARGGEGSDAVVGLGACDDLLLLRAPQRVVVVPHLGWGWMLLHLGFEMFISPFSSIIFCCYKLTVAVNAENNTKNRSN